MSAPLVMSQCANESNSDLKFTPYALESCMSTYMHYYDQLVRLYLSMHLFVYCILNFIALFLMHHPVPKNALTFHHLYNVHVYTHKTVY